MSSTAINITCIMLLLSMQAGHCQPPPAEAVRVSKQVLTNSTWLAEVTVCPASIMTTREVPADDNSCTGARLGSCLTECEAGSGPSCYWLAQELQKFGDGTRAPQALFQRACKLGVMSGCTHRAASMLSVKSKDQAMQRCAASTYSKACAFDEPWACTMYAFQLGVGIGVTQDIPGALKILDKFCKDDLEDPRCKHAKDVAAAIDKANQTPRNGANQNPAPTR